MDDEWLNADENENDNNKYEMQNNSSERKSQISGKASPFYAIEREANREGKKLAIIKDLSLGLFYLLLFLCACVSSAQTTMSGEYTVGSTDADYATIAEALTAYRGGTITGDVTFLLQAETFNESVDLEDISDGTFHFTIKGIDRDGSIINIDGTGGIGIGGSNVAGIVVEDSRNVTLENFTVVGGTFDYAIYFFDTHDSNLRQINFDGIDDAYSLRLESVSQFTIEDCDFAAFAENAIGSFGSDSVYVENSLFSNYTENGIFRGGGGIFGSSHLFIRNNVMQSVMVTNRDINLSDGGDFEISGNTINGSVYAEFFDGDLSGIIKNNEIMSEDLEAFVLFLNTPGGGDGTIAIYNNFLSSESNLGITVQQLGYPSVSFIHNTLINGGNTVGGYNFAAFENVLSDQTNTYKLFLINNIFQGVNTEALNVTTLKGVDSELVSDHNLLYSDIDEALATDYFQIEDETIAAGSYTFTEWQATFGGLLDQNSQSFEPEFVAADDFHITNGTDYRFGTYTDTLLFDIDGENRTGFIVDVGADQYKSDVTLSGEYIVGTSAGTDYATIGEALAEYRDAIIAGDVTYLLQAETFMENVNLGFLTNEDYHLTIKGSDRDNSVIEVSESETIGMRRRNNPDTGVGGAGIGIDESKNIALENFTLRGSVLRLGGEGAGIYIWDSDAIAIKSVTFENESQLSVFNHSSRSLSIEECIFRGSVNAGITDFVAKSGELSIIDCEFSNYRQRAVYVLSSAMTVRAEGNTFSSSVNSLASIQFDFDIENSLYATFIDNTTTEGRVRVISDSGSQIRGNKIFSEDGIALAIENEGYQSVSNNLLKSVTTSGFRDRSGNTDFIHNTVVSAADGAVFYSYGTSAGGENLNVVNNIFVGEGAPAFGFGWIYSEADIINLDHNLFYSDTEDLLYIGGADIGGETITENTNYTLAEWQALFSGLFDQNSQSFEPSFVSEEDLYLTHAMDYRFGTYIDTLATDIDGDLRMEGSVDIGADQYVCEASTSTLSVTVFDQYVWEGDVYNESGTFVKDFINSFGCDSTATISLTILALTSDNFIPIDENTEGVFHTITANEEVTFSLGTEKEEEWFILDGTQLSFKSAPDFEVPFEEGEDNDYFIDLIATDGAGNVSSVELIVSVVDVDETVLSAEDLAGSIGFYPNPVVDKVFFTSGKEMNVRILTIDGRLVVDQNVTGALDLSGLTKGSYLMEIREGNQQTTQRMIKIN